MPQPQRLYQRYYDVAKLVLWAEPVSEDSKRAQLILSFRDGNPRLVVYTGVEGKESVISFPMDIPTVTAVMLGLKDIASGPNDKREEVESLTTIYEDNKPTNQKKVLSTLLMGKSKDGIVYLCVISEGRPKIVFPIKSSPFHTWRTSNKEAIPEAIISARLALGISDMMLRAVGNVMTAYTDEMYSTGTKKSTSTKRDEAGGGYAGKAAATKPPEFADLDDLAL